jgi:hypothetical protein
MRSFLKFGAAALALSIAAPALAQTTPSTQTAPTESTDPSAAATGSASATAPGAQTGTATDASATVAAGQPVKDSTGATIGEVAEVKPDATGKSMATIKMGETSFAVDVNNLAVRDGATLINATQAEILAMMKK